MLSLSFHVSCFLYYPQIAYREAPTRAASASASALGVAGERSVTVGVTLEGREGEDENSVTVTENAVKGTASTGGTTDVAAVAAAAPSPCLDPSARLPIMWLEKKLSKRQR